MKNESVKEKIIEVTTSLIEAQDGDINKVTARMIAEKADIGLGLINYHFGSKENLITICVQRIIEKVVAGFSMKETYSTDKERLTACATYVFEFLFEHPAISRISILNDLQNYHVDNNSIHTQKGFQTQLKQEVSDSDKPLLTFVLTAAMQVAFLASPVSKDLLGYDFNKKEDRATYIKKLVSMLL